MVEEFAIVVAFENMQGTWSKGYTYKHPTRIAPDSVVVVPQKGFFGIGKVLKSVENYKFDPAINYKDIVAVLDIT